MATSAMGLFKLNKASLDSILGPDPEKDPGVRVPLSYLETFDRVVADLQDKIEEKKLKMFVSYDKMYRGAPELIVVLDENAPFIGHEDHYKDIVKYFLSCANTLELPYESESRFINVADGRLHGPMK